jgi:hypothetical protein
MSSKETVEPSEVKCPLKYLNRFQQSANYCSNLWAKLFTSRYAKKNPYNSQVRSGRKEENISRSKKSKE